MPCVLTDMMHLDGPKIVWVGDRWLVRVGLVRRIGNGSVGSKSGRPNGSGEPRSWLVSRLSGSVNSAKIATAERRTAEVTQRVEELQGILVRGLSRSAYVNVVALKRTVSVPPLDLGVDKHAQPAPQWEEFAPRQPGPIGRLFGGEVRHQHLLRRAQAEFEREQSAHGQRETQRQRRVAERRQAHAAEEDRARRSVEEHNASIDALACGLHARDREAVEQYFRLVLERLPLPKDFPRTAEVTYSDQGEQAVAQIELPGRAVVPTVRAYQYVRSKDEEREQPRPAKEIGELYRLVVSQIALLCVRDLFDSDQKLQSVSFNGHIRATNPATGQREYPCLISLSVPRTMFGQLVLSEVTPERCLRHLNALVSPHPYDLEPITPIVDFDLTKYSFVEGLDAVSSLDSRPDLMQMSPTEFEPRAAGV